VFLLRNKCQECNNPLASFATCLCRQRIGHEWLRTCAKRFGGLAVTTLLWWTSRSFIRSCLNA